MPRVVGRQTTRNNVEASSPSHYYRRAIWYPYLDSIITAMKEKFSTHQLTVLKLVALVPSAIEQYHWKDVADAFCITNLAMPILRQRKKFAMNFFNGRLSASVYLCRTDQNRHWKHWTSYHSATKTSSICCGYIVHCL